MSILKFKVISLFPELFPGPLNISIIGKALNEGVWGLDVINLRDFASDKHNNVDDSPYGGGSGMVLKPDTVSKALESIINQEKRQIIYFSPRGKLLKQSDIYNYVKERELILLCGRFEGIDQRVIDKYNIQEVSIGDYVLAGGELAAMVFMESCIRTLPGVISKDDVNIEESFGIKFPYANLLEYPHYTKPAIWQGLHVPEILLSGNHKKINEWRLEMAEEVTRGRRKDMWAKYQRIKKNIAGN